MSNLLIINLLSLPRIISKLVHYELFLYGAVLIIRKMEIFKLIGIISDVFFSNFDLGDNYIWFMISPSQKIVASL